MEKKNDWKAMKSKVRSLVKMIENCRAFQSIASVNKHDIKVCVINTSEYIIYFAYLWERAN